MLFLWFLPYIHGRFASENWGGLLFFAGLCFVLDAGDSRDRRRSSVRFALVGLLWGAAFYCRFQVGLAIAGAGAWLLVVDRAPLRSDRRTGRVVPGGLRVERGARPLALRGVGVHAVQLSLHEPRRRKSGDVRNPALVVLSRADAGAAGAAVQSVARRCARRKRLVVPEERVRVGGGSVRDRAQPARPQGNSIPGSDHVRHRAASRARRRPAAGGAPREDRPLAEPAGRGGRGTGVRRAEPVRPGGDDVQALERNGDRL